MKKIGIKNCFLIILLILIMVEGFLINGCLKNEKEILTPIDSLKPIARGFFMGVLPTTAQGQSFDSAYAQAAQYSEFVPVCGKQTPFYKMAAELSGKLEETFVNNLIRGKNMFPIIHLSFIGASMSLVTPPGIKNASLSNAKWRSEYKKAALDVVKAIQPQYLSLGNEVNRWYEKYGLEGINGFEHFITLYEEIYDEVKKISPKTKVFCIFARENISEHFKANLDLLKLFICQVNHLVFQRLHGHH
ncbi:MAG: hypothetical protein ACUVQN_04965 [Caldisericia bacterium]